MKYKFRTSLTGKWKTGKTKKDLDRAISHLYIRDTLEIKVECTHKNTWVDGGILWCKDCGEDLEVTSFRD